MAQKCPFLLLFALLLPIKESIGSYQNSVKLMLPIPKAPPHQQGYKNSVPADSKHQLLSGKKNLLVLRL